MILSNRIVPGLLFLGLVGCVSEANLNHNRPADAAWVNDCDPAGDDDSDGILNGQEGCMYATDTDGDQVPDYMDYDSDNDGIPDWLEAGDGDPSTVPSDFDGDGTPDFRDLDSDQDGVGDGDEDRNHDGKLGTCGTTCDMNPDECGAGQACLATGICFPPTTFECLQGETDRLNADTDGDGVPDANEGSFICNPQSESNPHGRRPVQFFSTDRFQIGTDEAAVILEQAISNHGDESDCLNGVDDDSDGLKDCADPDCQNTSDCSAVSITFDIADPTGPMAGFAFTREPKAATVEAENLLIVQELVDLFGEDHVFMRASGTPLVSHDNYNTVVRAIVEITSVPGTNLSDLRNEAVATLMNKRLSEYTNFPAASTISDSNFIFSYTVQRRTPAVGAPYVVVMGGIGSSSHYNDLSKRTGFRVDDASNGSGLASKGDGHEAECETYLVATQPVADVIWVIDESGSMYEEQESMAESAVDFFQRAISYGLDFRMGIVDVGLANDGRLCTGEGESGDYFLTPDRLTDFQACALHPWGSGSEEGGTEHGITQGYNAIVNHLPPADLPNRIRPDVQLVLIYVSDERAEELKDDCGAGEGGGMSAIDPACMQSVVGPTINLLQGLSVPGVSGRAHAIIGPPPDGCATADQVGQGYLEVVNATGGQIGSVCQTDLGTTLQIIIEDIVASSSPVILQHHPISVSVAVSKDGVALERSRTDGFDYRSSANTIVFVNQSFDPLSPSEVLVSYQRWTTVHEPPD